LPKSAQPITQPQKKRGSTRRRNKLQARKSSGTFLCIYWKKRRDEDCLWLFGTGKVTRSEEGQIREEQTKGWAPGSLTDAKRKKKQKVGEGANVDLSGRKRLLSVPER